MQRDLEVNQHRLKLLDKVHIPQIEHQNTVLQKEITREQMVRMKGLREIDELRSRLAKFQSYFHQKQDQINEQA